MNTTTATALVSRIRYITGPPCDNNNGNFGIAPLYVFHAVVQRSKLVRSQGTNGSDHVRVLLSNRRREENQSSKMELRKLLDRTARKNLSNPITLSPLKDGFSVPIFESRADTLLKKSLEDLALCGLRLFGAAATAPGVLDREVKGCGAGFVSGCRVAARLEQASHGGG